MGAQKYPVWAYVSPGLRDKRAVCNFCTKELYANPTDFKLQIVLGTCNSPEDVRNVMMLRLRDNQRKKKRGPVSLPAELDREVAAVAGAADGASAPKRKKPGEAAAADIGTGRGKITAFVRWLSHKESAELDARCAMCVYRSVLPLRTTEDLHFRSLCKALHPAYTPPSRFSISGLFLDNAHGDMKKVLDARSERALASSDAIVGGDLWTYQSMTSICSLFIFTPDPLYVETCVWGEERHSAVNTAASFKKRIDALGSRNVSAFVSDTEPKMLAVWEILERDYPTMIMLPCAANCLELTLEDICKYEDLRSALEFCTDMTQFWRHRYLPKTILERCQLGEYGKVLQLAHPGATRWMSHVSAAVSLLKTQCAMEKAVVDGSFKTQCLHGGSVTQKKAAEEVAAAVRDEKKWSLLALAVKLLEPLAVALDVGQIDGRWLGSVHHHMYRLRAHFFSFASPPGPERQQLKDFAQGFFNDREMYAMIPIHSLAYILDPRYVYQSNQPTAAESGGAFKLLKALEADLDTRLALSKHGVAEESLLPANYSHAT